MAVAYQPYRFTRETFYTIAASLGHGLHYELLDGTIYAVSPANPPHSAIISFFNHRFRILDATKYLVRVQDTLEIEPDGAPEPDLAIVEFRDDYYGARHPSGRDAVLVIEVGDTERKPRVKMRDYMRDARIPVAWRVDVPSRLVEIWEPANNREPVAILTGPQAFVFGGVRFTVDEMFSTVLKR